MYLSNEIGFIDYKKGIYFYIINDIVYLFNKIKL